MLRHLIRIAIFAPHDERAFGNLHHFTAFIAYLCFIHGIIQRGCAARRRASFGLDRRGQCFHLLRLVGLIDQQANHQGERPKDKHDRADEHSPIFHRVSYSSDCSLLLCRTHIQQHRDLHTEKSTHGGTGPRAHGYSLWTGNEPGKRPAQQSPHQDTHQKTSPTHKPDESAEHKPCPTRKRHDTAAHYDPDERPDGTHHGHAE